MSQMVGPREKAIFIFAISLRGLLKLWVIGEDGDSSGG